jgi:hypothetical protein
MHLRYLNSNNKNSILLVFFTLVGEVSFTQIMVNPNTNKSIESTNITQDQEELIQKELKKNEKINFPVFINTGNADLDNENYKKAKDAWVLANPEKYKQMISTNSLIVISKEEFLKLPIERQNEITGHPEKYILK